MATALLVLAYDATACRTPSKNVVGVFVDDIDAAQRCQAEHAAAHPCDTVWIISLPMGFASRPTPLFTTNVGEPIVGPRPGKSD